MSRLISSAALVALLLPASAAAATAVVGSSDGATHATIAAALADTPPSEDLEIILGAGDWPQVQLSEARAVLIRGENALDTSLEGVVVDHPDAVLSVIGVRITEAGAQVGPGTLGVGETLFAQADATSPVPAITVGAGGQLHAARVLVDEWQNPGGAFVFEADSAAEIRDVAFHGRAVADGPALRVQGGALFGENIDIIGGRAARGAGLQLEQGSAVVRDLIVREAEADVGAAVWIGGGTAYLTDVELRENHAGTGGQLAVDGGTLTLTRGRLYDGEAGIGGAFWVGSGMATFQNVLFWGHTAQGRAGTGAVDGGTVVVRQANVHGSVGPAVGGFDVRGGDLTVASSIFTFIDGQAMAGAGGGEVLLEDSLLWGVLASEPVGTGVGWEINGTVQDPRMRGAAAGDFALLADSPALDRGIGGAQDNDGTAADLGMYGGSWAWEMVDGDGDGFVDGRDCDDADPTVHEEADDHLYDGIDQDCDGRSDYDQDRDGFEAAAFGGTDCDDTDAAVFPGAREGGVDGIDQDCDGEDAPDRDGDGWVATLDCDDTDPGVNPDAREDWYDGVDQDCSGGSDYDRDGDGAESWGYGGTDCDDNDSSVGPEAAEVAGDGRDQDCDGEDLQPDTGSDAAAAAEAADGAGDETTSAPDPATGAAADAPASTFAKTGGCSVAGAAGAAGGMLPLVLGLVGVLRRRD